MVPLCGSFIFLRETSPPEDEEHDFESDCATAAVHMIKTEITLDAENRK